MSAGLQIRGLSKSFGGLAVAREINFDLAPGDRKALIGPNGAGKSTFANLLTGALTPSAGEIRLDGRDIGRLGEAARVKAGIAKTFQITTLFQDLTVRENILLPVLERRGAALRMFRRADADAQANAEVEALMAQFKLNPFAEVRVGDLAYGQQRLVEMTVALALKPRILILDEPAAGVPTGENHLITDAIAALPADLSVLIIEHDMALVFKVARAIVVLVAGAILVEGAPREIAANPRVRDLYLGSRHG